MLMNAASFKKSLLPALILSLLLATACAANQNTPAAGSEDALRERVNILWQAKTDNDWAVVYEMADKKFRQSISRDQFTRGESLVVKGYTIDSVTIDPDNPDKASSMVIFKTYKFARLFEMSVKEEWLLEDGEWHIKLSDPRTPFDKRTE